MHSNLLSLVFSIIMIASISCGRDKSDAGYVTYNLGEVGKKIEVRLSDLMDDIHLVKLELNAEFPVSENMNQWIGDKHILLITRKNVLQYTSGGLFVRELITSGRGPEEFEEVDLYDVNESKNVFYFYDDGSAGKIRRIDLSTGEFLESLILPDDERWMLADFIVYRDKLLCFTNNFSAVDYRYFILGDNGDIEYGCKKQAYLEDRPQVSKSPYLSETGGRVNYRQVRDTLFFLDEDTLAIEMIIREDNYFSPGENRNRGFSPWIQLNGITFLLIRNTELELLQREGGGIGIEDHGSRNLLISRKEKSIVEVSHFFIDYFGLESDNLEFKYNDDNAWIVLNSIELMDYINKACENRDIESELQSKLMSLRESVDENDNPYLLIGKLK